MIHVLNGNMKKLDLHHTRHHLVRPKLIRFIEDHWNTDTEAEIITGNSTKMKEIVTDVLNEYKLEYRIGDIFGTNKGYIKTEI